MDPRLEPLATVLALNTRLLHNRVEGVDDETGLAHASDGTNHMTFLGAHLVGARAFMAGMLGQDATDPFEEQRGAVSSIDEATSFPTLAEIRAAWDEVSKRVEAGLEATTSEELDAGAEHPFPVDDDRLLGKLAFLRKHPGHDAMSYE